MEMVIGLFTDLQGMYSMGWMYVCALALWVITKL